MSEPLIPAATVVVIDQTDSQLKVLMVKRSSNLSAFAGSWVFPGGKVDLADKKDTSDETLSARQAACREVFEEVGLSIDMAQLLPFAHWTTPRGYKKRFSTWFFAVGVNSEQQNVKVDQQEIVDARWIKPMDALASHAQGELPLTPPTFVTLTEFSKFDTSRDLFSALKSQRPFYFLPVLVETESDILHLYEGDDSYETKTAMEEGVRHRLVVNKKDTNRWTYLKP